MVHPPKIINPGTDADAQPGNTAYNAYDDFLKDGTATLRLNNTLRFKERAGKYFDSPSIPTSLWTR